jgi:hypothetical protein
LFFCGTGDFRNGVSLETGINARPVPSSHLRQTADSVPTQKVSLPSINKSLIFWAILQVSPLGSVLALARRPYPSLHRPRHRPHSPMAAVCGPSVPRHPSPFKRPTQKVSARSTTSQSTPVSSLNKRLCAVQRLLTQTWTLLDGPILWPRNDSKDLHQLRHPPLCLPRASTNLDDKPERALTSSRLIYRLCSPPDSVALLCHFRGSLPPAPSKGPFPRRPWLLRPPLVYLRIHARLQSDV